MKRIMLALFAMLLFTPFISQSQTTEDFWHKRPRIVQKGAGVESKILSLASVNATRMELKPAVTVSVMGFSPSSVSGEPWVVGTSVGVGPGLMLANTTQDLETGVNSVNYSITASILFGTTFKGAPFAGTSASLMFATFNDLLSVGGQYAFYIPADRKPWMITVGTQIPFTLN